MLRTNTCGELSKKDAGKKAILCGWAEHIKLKGKIGFLNLRDRYGITQIFLNQKLCEQLKDVKREAVLLVQGEIKVRPEANAKLKTGEIEVSAEKIEVLNNAEPLPLETTDINTDISKRLDYRFLDTRRPEINAIFNIRSKILKAVIDFFDQNKFINIQTPKLTVIGVESGAELFNVKYFNREVCLAQSPQIYKQMFVIGGLEKVYEIGPVFRAEKSHTTRHLTEFTGIDFEMGFIKDENDVMDVIEEMMKHTIKSVKENCNEELKLLKIDVDVPKKIPRITLAEAKKLLKEKGKILPEDEDPDPEAEKLIGSIIKEKYKSDFVFLTRYPVKKRPFYHMRPEDDQTTTKSFDLIWNGVEVATGAQREHRLDILRKQAKEKGIDLDKEMKNYADIFKYGAPPHGGVGFGLDRLTQRLLNIENIREVILLPRDPERITP